VRRAGLTALAALIALAPMSALAQPAEPPGEEPSQDDPSDDPSDDPPQDGSSEPPDEEPADDEASGEPAREPLSGDQELAGSLGIDFGGRVSPGGLHLAGAYLYRLSDEDWFDGGLSFTFGGGGAACFRDRDDVFLCDHGVVNGFGGEAFAGVRRYFPGQGTFTPYARAALGLRVVTFGDDDINGVAVPLQLGGGVRAQVADRISVSGGAELRLGPAWFNRDLGSEPHLGLAVHGGIEFRL